MNGYAHTLLGFGLILALATGGGQQDSGASGGHSKLTFLVVYKPGPSWLPGKPMREQPLKEHGRYVLSLHAKGMLKFAGPFSDDAGGALVFEATDEAEAREIIAKDPAVVSQVFVPEMHPWTLIDWERMLKK